MDPIFGVVDRFVVLTGGMGQLGAQFASVLAQRRANVAIFDLQANRAAPPAALQAGLDAGRIRLFSVDITNRESIEAALQSASAEWGAPYALINNAALDSPPGSSAAENGPFEDYPTQSWEKVIDVNVKGVFLCCQVVGGAMAKAGRGSIVNISSIYGLVSPDQRIYEYRREQGGAFFKPAAYSVSKSALLNLTRYLATYWAPQNVRVNTLTFGGVFNGQDERFLAGYTSHVPLGRMANADEYNGAMLFLLSDASSYMTGSNLVIDGGWTAW